LKIQKQKVDTIDPKRNIKLRADKLAQAVYNLTEKFPRYELFVLTSQLRRSILSVPANIIEGYARNRSKLFLNHLEIAFGSLAESRYFIYFAYKRKYITKEEYDITINEAIEITKMLWSSIKTVSQRINNN
jgi:four helix bundle protein